MALAVAAGHPIGESTFLSGLFQDQPSIEAMTALGLDVSSVGNHEFDEGTNEVGGSEGLASLADYFKAHPGLTPPADRVDGV